jgi:cytochrome bd-type quinol oxidase subunit 2
MSTAARNPIASTTVRTSVVNRTHRVVRERARAMQAQRSRNRSLFAPILIASSLIIMIVSACWFMFDEYEMFADATTDARFHLPILLIWFLPVTGALLIVALVRRAKSGSASQENR